LLANSSWSLLPAETIVGNLESYENYPHHHTPSWNRTYRWSM
jgi:hypothetical protein